MFRRQEMISGGEVKTQDYPMLACSLGGSRAMPCRQEMASAGKVKIQDLTP